MSKETGIAPLYKISALMGHVENGSDVCLHMFQDDATGDFHITAYDGKREVWSEYGGTLEEVVDKAYVNRVITY